STSRGVAHQCCLLQIERLDHSCEIIGIAVHVVSRRSLAGSAVPTSVMRNDTEAFLHQKKHLTVPSIGAKRPSMGERYDWAFTPVFVVDCRAVFHCNRTHVSFLLKFVRAELRLVCRFNWPAPTRERLFPSQRT